MNIVKLRMVTLIFLLCFMIGCSKEEATYTYIPEWEHEELGNLRMVDSKISSIIKDNEQQIDVSITIKNNSNKAIKEMEIDLSSPSNYPHIHFYHANIGEQSLEPDQQKTITLQGIHYINGNKIINYKMSRQLSIYVNFNYGENHFYTTYFRQK